MNIRDLRDGMRRVDIEGMVVWVGEPRDVNRKDGGIAKVEETELQDATGKVKLNLWDDEIDQIVKDATVRITNGYTNAFRGQLAVNVGRYGKLEVMEGEPKAERSTQTSFGDPFTAEQEARIRQIVAEELVR